MGTLTYATASGKFEGTVDLGTITSADYNVNVSSDGYLSKLIANINIAGGQQNNASARLTTGNVTNEEKNDALTIQDYTVVLGCVAAYSTDEISYRSVLKEYKDKCNSDPKFKALSDLDDNGIYNDYDLNLWVREIGNQYGGNQ
jgi:hypothetical protein